MNKPIKKIKLGAKTLMLAAVATIALSTVSCSEEEGEEIIQYNDKVIISTNKYGWQIDCGIGETFELVENRSESAALKFSSKDPDIASVDEMGKMKALKAGQTDIYGLMNNDTALRVNVGVFPIGTLKTDDKESQLGCKCSVYWSSEHQGRLFLDFYKDGIHFRRLSAIIDTDEKSQAQTFNSEVTLSPIYPNPIYADGFEYTFVGSKENSSFSATDNGDGTYKIVIEATGENNEKLKVEYNGQVIDQTY